MEAVYSLEQAVGASYLCECIECGYLLESAEHCSSLLCPQCGGQMRRAERPGPGQPSKAVPAFPGEKVELTYGEKLRVNVSLQHKGPACEATLYGTIGIRGLTFDEKVHGEFFPWKFPNSSDWEPASASVEIPITSDIRPGVAYDIQCKLLEYAGAGFAEADDAVDIVGMPPSYTLVYTHTYDRAKTYRGKAETCIAEFRVDLPDQLFPKSWVVDKIASTFDDEVKKQGAEMLQVKIYEDATPLLWTYYRIEATATKPALPAGMFAAVQIAWGIVIYAVLAIILLAIALAIVIEIKEFDWPGLGKAAIGMGLIIAAVVGAAAVAMMAAKKKKERR